MWEESDMRTPMICLLSMGSDPTSSIEALAKRKNLSKSICFISASGIFLLNDFKLTLTIK